MITYFGQDIKNSLSAYGSAWTLFLLDTDVLANHNDLLEHSQNVIPMTVNFANDFAWAGSRSIFATSQPHVDLDTGIVNYVAEITSPIIVSDWSALKTILMQNGSTNHVMSDPVDLSVVQESNRFYIAVAPTAAITVTSGANDVLVESSGYYDLVGTNFTISGTGIIEQLRFLTGTKPTGIKTFTHALFMPNSADTEVWADLPFFITDLVEAPLVFSRTVITHNERVFLRAGNLTPRATVEV